jgi:PKD repeat protein
MRSGLLIGVAVVGVIVLMLSSSFPPYFEDHPFYGEIGPPLVAGTNPVLAPHSDQNGVPRSPPVGNSFTGPDYPQRTPAGRADASLGPTPALTYGSPISPAWANISSGLNPSPPGRWWSESQMTYDPIDGYVLLFGGFTSASYLNDTWTFQNGAWRQLFPTVSPPARDHAAMVWDSADGYAVLFGGVGGSGQPLNDTWSFVDGNWTQLHPSDSPSARWGMSMVWDAVDNEVLLFGGCTESLQVNDTWTFSRGNWTELSSESPPPGREDASMAFDATSGATILFGGYYWTTSSPIRLIILGDTWRFSDGNWTQVMTNESPSARYLGDVAYFAPIQSIVLFAGASSPTTVLADTWWFSQDGWSEHNTSTISPALTGAGIAADPSNHSLLVFSGGNTTAYGNPDTWEYYVANLSAGAEPLAGDAPLNVSLHANGEGGFAPYVYNWSLPQGPNASGPEANLTLRTSGEYHVRLALEDANGATAVATINITVYPAFQLTAVAAPLSGPAPLNVSGEALASGGDPPYQYLWSTGTGATQATASVSLDYSLPGSYTLTVALSDAFGIEGTKRFSVEVAPSVVGPAGLAVSVAANRTEGSVPFSIQYATAVSGGLSPFNYAWEFGDGGTSTLAQPTHTFAAAGTFQTNLTVSDAQGISAASSVKVTLHPALAISIDSSARSGQAPIEVNFSSAPIGGWEPYTVLWEFGDGASGFGENVTHTYSTSGNFSATAEVIDSLGERVNASSLALTVGPSRVVSQPTSGGSISPDGAAGLSAATFVAGVLITALAVWLHRHRTTLPK